MKNKVIFTLLAISFVFATSVAAGNTGTANSVRGNISFLDESGNLYFDLQINAQQAKDSRPTKGSVTIKSDSRVLKFDVVHMIVAGKTARLSLECKYDSYNNLKLGSWMKMKIVDGGDRKENFDSATWEWNLYSQVSDYALYGGDIIDLGLKSIKGDIIAKSF